MDLKRLAHPLIVIALTALATFAMPVLQKITMNSDDGTEVNSTEWFEGGVESCFNRVGSLGTDHLQTGLRYFLDDFNPGDELAYARLRFAAFGGGWTRPFQILIKGVLQDSASTFSAGERPSQKRPKTRAKVSWRIDAPWEKGDLFVPLWYSSPDISGIINEILRLPKWGQGLEGKSIALTLKGPRSAGPDAAGFIQFRDYQFGTVKMKSAAMLETFRTVYDTFLGRELPGRVTDRSAVVNLYSLLDTDTYIEYGTMPGLPTFATPAYLNQHAEEPIEIVLDNLMPDTRYYYRLRYRKAQHGAYLQGEEHSFHTQRPRGGAFCFSITADEHLQSMYKLPGNLKKQELYSTTLQNLAESQPDFYLSLGDFAHTEYYQGRSAKTPEEARDRYLLQRKHIDDVAHSIPFFLVLGNHEGEQGWHYYMENEDKNNLAYMSTAARNAIIPNPLPDAFYSGSQEIVPDMGQRENFYAWEWGDALFMVLDPYWYSKRKPHDLDQGPGSHDGWDWTLGWEQYEWLYETLHDSKAAWKFVFTHQLVSTVDDYYGRGGIEVAKHKVANNPSFEWGGENEAGEDIFEVKRPGWSHGPIHDLLVAEGVDIVFHGHDHFFGFQELDGIVYLECPQPGDATYSFGYKNISDYVTGDFVENSGHVDVHVGPDAVVIEYVRAFLPGDGNNGEIGYSKVLTHRGIRGLRR
ncbi:MAG: alkaline phosphatase D family protein [Planctomycetota bacterium]